MMMNLKNIFRAAFLLSCFFIAGCENSVQQVNDFTHRKAGVEEAKNIVIDYSIAGRARSKITAPLMLRYQDSISYVEFPKSLHADFFNAETLQTDSKLDAKYARYMEAESRVFLKDSVRVFNINGDTLYCNELYWDRSRVGNEFYTDKPVRIRTKTHIIDGDGLNAPQDFKEWNIINPKGFVKVPANQFPG
ncbi:hypothetical protein BH09BAC2_BH09BAC2_04060 [soil metagenome]